MITIMPPALTFLSMVYPLDTEFTRPINAMNQANLPCNIHLGRKRLWIRQLVLLKIFKRCPHHPKSLICSPSISSFLIELRNIQFRTVVTPVLLFFILFFF
jgi:hypothetical protein